MDPNALASSAGGQLGQFQSTDNSQFGVQNLAQWQSMIQEYYKTQPQMAAGTAYAAPLSYGNLWASNPLMAYGALPFYGGMFTGHFPASQQQTAQMGTLAPGQLPTPQPQLQMQLQPQQQQNDLLGAHQTGLAEEQGEQADADKAEVSSSQGETQQTGANPAQGDGGQIHTSKDQTGESTAPRSHVEVKPEAEGAPIPMDMSNHLPIPGTTAQQLPAGPSTIQLPSLAAYWGAMANGTSAPAPAPAVPTTSLGSSDMDLPPGVDPSTLDEKDLKKLRRKQSNRESARRSRLRKQAETEQLSKTVKDLVTESNQLKQSMEHFKLIADRLTQEKMALMQQVRQLGGHVPPEMEWGGLMAAAPAMMQAPAQPAVQILPVAQPEMHHTGAAPQMAMSASTPAQAAPPPVLPRVPPAPIPVIPGAASAPQPVPQAQPAHTASEQATAVVAAQVAELPPAVEQAAVAAPEAAPQQ